MTDIRISLPGAGPQGPVGPVGPIGPIGPVGPPLGLSTLPHYTDEQAAIAAGLTAGEAFIVAPGSDVNQVGSIMVVMAGLMPGTGPTLDLSVLPHYTDDADAIAGGLFTGNLYIVAAGSDAHQTGTLRVII
jgi:hypothetical protein